MSELFTGIKVFRITKDDSTESAVVEQETLFANI